MRRFAVMFGWLLIVGIAGCAHSPGGKIDAAKAFSFESGRTPYSAAICIARNAKSLPDITAEERLLGDASWEVVVRRSGWTAGTLAIAQAHNNGIGSIVSVQVTDLQRGDHQSFARQLLADCQAQMIAR
ncbi:MAG TPA: hypothetical protein VFG44_06735 [Burkholderiales bacterium]|nr:hypothetical protein [Burkholderiales bacterium]